MKISKNKKIGYYLAATAFFMLLLYAMLIAESAHPDASIKSYFDLLWYSVVTLTTVGYGDYYPVSTAGKIIGIFLVMSSLGMFGYLISSLTGKLTEYMEKKKNGFYGTDFEKHIIILGWDRFSKQIVDQIVSAGNKVVVVTNNKNEIELIYDLYQKKDVFAIFADFNNFDALNKANVLSASSVFINFTTDTDTLVYVLNFKKFFPATKLVVCLDNSDLKETFNAAGVTYAISKNEIASKLIASFIFEPDVALLTEDLISTTTDKDEHDIQQYLVTQDNPFINQDYLEAYIKLKVDLDCILLGLARNIDGNNQILKNPSKGTIVKENDYLLVISDGDHEPELEKAFGVKQGRVTSHMS